MIGTTPTHRFRCSIDPALLVCVRVIYKQKDAEVLRKETKDIKTEGDFLVVSLSQEETFLFDCTTPIKVQIRGKTSGGKVMKSNIITIKPSECFDREVL